MKKLAVFWGEKRTIAAQISEESRDQKLASLNSRMLEKDGSINQWEENADRRNPSGFHCTTNSWGTDWWTQTLLQGHQDSLKHLWGSGWIFSHFLACGWKRRLITSVCSLTPVNVHRLVQQLSSSLLIFSTIPLVQLFVFCNKIDAFVYIWFQGISERKFSGNWVKYNQFQPSYVTIKIKLHERFINDNSMSTVIKKNRRFRQEK